jgi:hypothetical protein
MDARLEGLVGAACLLLCQQRAAMTAAFNSQQRAVNYQTPWILFLAFSCLPHLVDEVAFGLEEDSSG